MTYKLTYFLVCDKSSSVGLCMHDYKSLRVVVMICVKLVNEHTDTHRRLS